MLSTQSSKYIYTSVSTVFYPRNIYLREKRVEVTKPSVSVICQTLKFPKPMVIVMQLCKYAKNH